MTTRALADSLTRLLSLRLPPVAVAFRDQAPDGVPRVPAPQPAGCGYWRLAAEGQTFYTEATDHHGCPVGAHTHNVPMPPDVAKQLEGLIGTMIGLEYLSAAEIPQIPRRATPFQIAVYSPLADAPCEPDLVLVRGTARQLMLLAEAAQSCGAAGDGPAMGRPTCAVIPQTLASGRTAASFGCVGNRVYTGAGDDEAYSAIPGARLAEVVARLEVVARANDELEKFHRARL